MWPTIIRNLMLVTWQTRKGQQGKLHCVFQHGPTPRGLLRQIECASLLRGSARLQRLPIHEKLLMCRVH